MINKLLQKYPWPKQCPDRDYYMHGWLRDENKKLLKELLADFENPVVLEIGCWLGMSAEYMLNLNDNLQLITVDTFKGSAELKNNDKAQELIRKGLYEQSIRNLWKYKDRLVIIKKDSASAIKELWKSNLKPDLIYIDGSHQYKDVVSDIFLSIVDFPEAIVCGDDLKWHDVKMALKYIEKTYGKIVYEDNNFWMLSE